MSNSTCSILGKEGKDANGKPIDIKGLTPDFTFNHLTNPKKGPYQVTFASGEPPTAQIEFEIDPVKLAQHPAGAKLTEESKDAAIKKPVLKEGDWAVRARIPKHPEEVFPDAEHVRERTGIQVIQKKLRVLVIAGAPSREFQFLRNVPRPRSAGPARDRHAPRAERSRHEGTVDAKPDGGGNRPLPGATRSEGRKD